MPEWYVLYARQERICELCWYFWELRQRKLDMQPSVELLVRESRFQFDVNVLPKWSLHHSS